MKIIPEKLFSHSVSFVQLKRRMSLSLVTAGDLLRIAEKVPAEVAVKGLNTGESDQHFILNHKTITVAG